MKNTTRSSSSLQVILHLILLVLGKKYGSILCKQYIGIIFSNSLLGNMSNTSSEGICMGSMEPPWTGVCTDALPGVECNDSPRFLGTRATAPLEIKCHVLTLSENLLKGSHSLVTTDWGSNSKPTICTKQGLHNLPVPVHV